MRLLLPVTLLPPLAKLLPTLLLLLRPAKLRRRRLSNELGGGSQLHPHQHRAVRRPVAVAGLAGSRQAGITDIPACQFSVP